MKEFILYIREGSEERELARFGPEQADVFQCGRGEDADGCFGVGNREVSHHQFDVYGEGGQLYVVNRGRGRMKRHRKEWPQDERVKVVRGLKFDVAGISFRFDEAACVRAPYELVIRSGAARGRHALTRKSTSVGRREGAADIVVKADGISKIHFELTQRDSETEPFTLHDLGSTNGVKLGPPAPRMIAPGEESPVRIGQDIFFGAACARLEKSKPHTSARKMRPLAAGLLVLAVLWALVPGRSNNAPQCQALIEKQMAESNLWVRATKIIDLAPLDYGISGCASCSNALAVYKQDAGVLRNWMQKGKSIRSGMNELSRLYVENLWSEDKSVLGDRSEKKRNIQELVSKFESETPNLVQPANSPPSKHGSLKWPALATANEVEACRAEISSFAGQQLTTWGSMEKDAEKLLGDSGADIRVWTRLEENFKQIQCGPSAVVEEISLMKKGIENRNEAWERLAAEITCILDGTSRAHVVRLQGMGKIKGLPVRLQAILDRDSLPETFNQLKQYLDDISQASDNPVEVCRQTIRTLEVLEKNGLSDSVPKAMEIKNTLQVYRNTLREKWQVSAARLNGIAKTIPTTLDPTLINEWKAVFDEAWTSGSLADFGLPFDEEKDKERKGMEEMWTKLVKKIDEAIQTKELSGEWSQPLKSLLEVERQLKKIGALQEGDFKSVEAAYNYIRPSDMTRR